MLLLLYYQYTIDDTNKQAALYIITVARLAVETSMYISNLRVKKEKHTDM